MKRKTVDTKTRFHGVYARHKLACALAIGGEKCTCEPSYFGVVWDREAGKQRKTKFCQRAGEASNLREDLLLAVRAGTLPAEGKKVPLRETRAQFLKGVRKGVVLNKRGRRYKKRSIESLESSLNHLPDPMLRKATDEVRSGEVQSLIDSLAERDPPLSGSRIRGVVHSVRALYRFARYREFATKDPAEDVLLPALDESVRDRVARPDEFVALLDALLLPTPSEVEEGKTRSPREALRLAVPYALAAYGTARNQEIRTLDWTHVHFELGALELAADEGGRKPGGSWRIVPIVAPLMAILRGEWIAHGRPTEGKVCKPRRGSKSGLIALDNIQERVRRRWVELSLDPIGLQEARHTAATWLDHAGVSPKVASEIMGHKTPEYRPGAARITLQRYTHMLPGELEYAREQMETFLRQRGPDRSTFFDSLHAA